MLIRTFFVLVIMNSSVTVAQSASHLVELFTSEGCSSCPPADKVFATLTKHKEVALLSWHVDYWDDIGWPDAYSHSKATPRQKAYATAFRNQQIYTPQIIFNGRTEFVGSDRTRVVEALRSPMNSSIDMEFEAKLSNDTVVISGNISNLEESTTSYLAVTEDKLSSKVTRGENRGKVLHHQAVVRHLIPLGALKGKNNQLAQTIKLNPTWKKEDLHIVVWVEDEATMRTRAAATLKPR